MSLALLLAAATPFASLDAIDAQVARFTGAAIGGPGGALTPLDRRLRLQPCPAPLVLAWHGVRRDAVVVQCPDGARWRVYVPVGSGTAPHNVPPAIQRGEGVTIAVSGQGFAVSRPGEALEAGAIGAWIRVRPATADAADRRAAEPMRAQVVRPGVVSVPLD